MFELLGDQPETAAAEAQTVMRIETALAKGSMTRVERRDPKSLDHKMTSAELEKTFSRVPMAGLFRQGRTAVALVVECQLARLLQDDE